MELNPKYFLCLLLLVPINAQLISPCPKLFKYEPQAAENDRWYGTLTLTSDSELMGVWLRVIFDKPSKQLGNWFGEVVTTDNKEYLIKNRNYKLQANTPFRLRIFVVYNPNETPPQLMMFRLNAKTVCPENSSATTEAAINTGEPLTSSILSSTANPLHSGSNAGSVVVQPSHSSIHSHGEDPSPGSGSDIFSGDFPLQFPGQIRPTAPPRPSVQSTKNAACGTVAARPNPLISYGQNTTQGQWPWHAALYHTQGAHLIYTCGATLISENHVLTAAHCVTRPQTTRPIDITRLSVYLGKYSLKKFGVGTQDREVSNIFVHPEYNYTVFFNDIAVVKLKDPVDLTNYVRPCCLWEDSVELEQVLNKLGTVVGWGFDEKRQISDTLLQAQMPVVSPVSCIYSNRDFYSQFTFEKTYCAGYRNGTTVCNGDSGGGMVFPKSGTSGRNTVWQIRGIISVGVALQGQGVCDPRQYIVFTDVAKHIDWIKQVMRR